jgi:hypothetical protein
VKRAFLLAGVALASCSPVEFIEAPPGRGSAIVAWFEGTTARAVAFDGSRYTQVLPDDGETVVVLIYDHPLSARQLVAGEILPSTIGRPLPLGESSFIKTPDGNEFEPIDALPAELAEFLIPALDPSCPGLENGCSPAGRSDLCLQCEPSAAPASPTAPSLPAAPRLTPPACPDRWRLEPDADGSSRCVPDDPERASPCGAAEVRWYGETECRPVAGACPADRFAEVLGAALYVDPQAAQGGDGSRATPLRTIAEAIALAEGAASSTVVLARATFVEEDLSLPPGATLLGACAESVVRARSLGTRGEGGALRNLALAADELQLAGDAEIAGVLLAGDESAAPTRVLVIGAARLARTVIRGAGAAIEVSGSLAASEVVADAGCFHAVVAGGRLSLERAIAFEVTPCGPGSMVDARGGAVVELDTVSLSGGVLLFESTGALHAVSLDPGRATGLVLDGASAEVRFAQVKRSSGGSVQLYDGSMLGAVDVSFAGVEVLYSTFTATRAVLEESELAFALRGSGALTDAVVRRFTHGVSTDERSQLALTRVAIGGDGSGIGIASAVPAESERPPCDERAGFTASLVATDVSVRDVDSAVVTYGGSARLDRVAVERATHGPAFCDGAVVLRDLTILDTSSTALDLYAGQNAGRIERLAVEGSGGVVLRSSMPIAVTDATLERIDGLAVSLVSSRAGSQRLARVRIDGALDIGLLLLGGPSEARDVEVRGVRRMETAQGRGIVVEKGELALSRFAIRGSSDVGLQLVGSRGALTSGVIEGHPIGLDLVRSALPILTETIFENNDTAIRTDGR